MPAIARLAAAPLVAGSAAKKAATVGAATLGGIIGGVAAFVVVFSLAMRRVQLHHKQNQVLIEESAVEIFEVPVDAIEVVDAVPIEGFVVTAYPIARGSKVGRKVSLLATSIVEQSATSASVVSASPDEGARRSTLSGTSTTEHYPVVVVQSV
jgi:hypothetical protein